MRKSFTIIELLLVIAIISALAAVSASAFTVLVGSAKVARALHLAQNHITYAKDYYNKNGQFPGLAIVNAYRTETTHMCDYPDCGDSNIDTIFVGYSNQASTPTGVVQVRFTTDFKDQYAPFGVSNRRSVHFVIKDVDGALEVRCGQGAISGNTPDLDTALLPDTCIQDIAVWFNE